MHLSVLDSVMDSGSRSLGCVLSEAGFFTLAGPGTRGLRVSAP